MCFKLNKGIRIIVETAGGSFIYQFANWYILLFSPPNTSGENASDIPYRVPIPIPEKVSGFLLFKIKLLPGFNLNRGVILFYPFAEHIQKSVLDQFFFFIIGEFHAAETDGGFDVTVIIAAAADKNAEFSAFPGIINTGVQLVIAGIGLHPVYAEGDNFGEKLLVTLQIYTRMGKHRDAPGSMYSGDDIFCLRIRGRHIAGAALTAEIPIEAGEGIDASCPAGAVGCQQGMV